jgi:hypothetical protein
LSGETTADMRSGRATRDYCIKMKAVYLTTCCLVMAGSSLALAQTTTVNPPPIMPPPMPAAPPPVAPMMINPSINMQPINSPQPNLTPATRQSLQQSTQTTDPLGPGGSHSGPLPPTPLDQALTVAVCGDSEKRSDECLGRGEREAIEKLSEFYATQYAKKVMNSSFTVTFPKALSRTDQLGSIARIEKAALAAAVTQMEADVAKLTATKSDNEKQAIMNASGKKVKQWEQSATSEADNGSNWTHDWTSNTHRFTEGDAYRQLKSISING